MEEGKLVFVLAHPKGERGRMFKMELGYMDESGPRVSIKLPRAGLQEIHDAVCLALTETAEDYKASRTPEEKAAMAAQPDIMLQAELLAQEPPKFVSAEATLALLDRAARAARGKS